MHGLERSRKSLRETALRTCKWNAVPSPPWKPASSRIPCSTVAFVYFLFQDVFFSTFLRGHGTISDQNHDGFVHVQEAPIWDVACRCDSLAARTISVHRRGPARIHGIWLGEITKRRRWKCSETIWDGPVRMSLGKAPTKAAGEESIFENCSIRCIRARNERTSALLWAPANTSANGTMD